MGLTWNLIVPFKLDPVKKAAWIAALRFGRFEQFRNAVHDAHYRGLGGTPTARCCMGVGAFIIRGSDVVSTDDAAAALDLPEWLKELFIDLNDVLKWDFLQISDWIEACL